MVHIVIIGGGAAGFFGAIACAESSPSAKISIFEKNKQLLSKVRISGGGRCNVTHACFDPALLIKNYPRGHKALLGPFMRFQPKDIFDWFDQRGVELKIESDGRVFPRTDQSDTIISCLMKEAKALKIGIECQKEVVRIETVKDGSFILHFTRDPSLSCDKILFAGGGASKTYQMIEALGHQIIPAVPSLFTFNISDERLTGLEGISHPLVEVDIPAIRLKQKGPILITHWGLSGPAILKISAWGARDLNRLNYRAEIRVNWLPNYSEEAIIAKINLMKEKSGKKQINTEGQFDLSKSLWRKLVQSAQIPPERTFAHLSKSEMMVLKDVLTKSTFHIEGKSTHKEEFVTCGGVRLDEVDFRTMQSRILPNLYFAGEILDIDGVTGGFNFQNAWTTSWIAGKSMAQS